MCSRVKEEWGRGLQRLPPVSRMGGRQGVVATRRARLSAIVSVANATTGAMSVRIVFDTFRQPLFLVERPASAPFVVEVSGVRPLFLSLQLGRGKQVLQCLATNSVLGPTLGGSGGRRNEMFVGFWTSGAAWVRQHVISYALLQRRRTRS